jgi:hypothetical protein
MDIGWAGRGVSAELSPQHDLSNQPQAADWNPQENVCDFLTQSSLPKPTKSCSA